MDAMQTMKHELAVRAQIITDLQAEKERMVVLVNAAQNAVQRMREEAIFVTMKTHAVVKAMMLINSQTEFTLPGHMLKKGKFWILEKGESVEGDKDALTFKMREMDDKEREKEEALVNKVEAAEKRIKQAPAR